MVTESTRLEKKTELDYNTKCTQIFAHNNKDNILLGFVGIHAKV